jgi:hypothetical protein
VMQSVSQQQLPEVARPRLVLRLASKNQKDYRRSKFLIVFCGKARHCSGVAAKMH